MKDNKSIIKSNKIVEASYKLNLNEQKFILFMCSRIKREDEHFDFYEMKVTDIAAALDLKKSKNFYKELRDIIIGLNKKTLSIQEKDGPLIVSWVASSKYFDKQGKISFEFSKRLKPYLLQLKREFVTYRLKTVIQLKSTFSIRIYELLKQYEKIGKRIIKLDELRNFLGIDEGKYELYGDIKRYILNVALEELNNKTDIYFNFNEIKTGRKVTAIEFFIHPNNKYNVNNTPMNLFPTTEETPDIIDELIKEGVGQDEAQKIWKQQFDYLAPNVKENVIKHDIRFATYLAQKLGLFRISAEHKKIENPGAWLRNAIKFNWVNPKIEEAEALKKKQTIQHEIQQRIDLLNREKDKLENKMFEETHKIYQKEITQNPSALKEAFAILKSKRSFIYNNYYDKKKSLLSNYKHVLFKGEIQEILDKNLPEAIKIKKEIGEALSECDVKIGKLKKELKNKINEQTNE